MTEQQNQIPLEKAPDIMIKGTLYDAEKLIAEIEKDKLAYADKVIANVNLDIERFNGELARRAQVAKQPAEEVVEEAPVLEGEVIPAQA